MKKGSITILLLLIVACLSYRQASLQAQMKAYRPDGKASIMQNGGSKASVERGKKVYTTYCLSCHQADGSGVPRLNPPLIQTTWVLGDKNRLINIILQGMDEPIEVDGEEYENVMAPHGFLKDEEIADVLTYVRNSFGNKASAVTPAEVKAARISGEKLKVKS